MTRPMTGEEKIDFVHRELRNCAASVALTGSGTITCPYCQGVTEFGADLFCCQMMGAVVAAICERQDVDHSREIIERVMEKHQNN